MKVKIKTYVEVDVKILQLVAKVRYWEDSEVNGESDTENGDNVPCKTEDNWCPRIDIESGVILNWEKGKTANIHYKVCDQCSWGLIDENGLVILSVEDEYVPKTLCPKENGYGDYIIMDIDENGKISDWECNINDLIMYYD